MASNEEYQQQQFWSPPDLSLLGGDVKSQLNQMFKDELMFGVSGCHISDKGVIKRLPPDEVNRILQSRNK